MTADVDATVSPRRPAIVVTVTTPAQVPAMLIPVLSSESPAADVDFLTAYLLTRG